MAKITDIEAFTKVTGELSEAQVEVVNAILAATTSWPVGWVAYGLATAWHEAKFKPQDEIGKGRGRPYGVIGRYGQVPYGRGLVQLTWDGNYEWADHMLGLNGRLLKNFELANDTVIAARILAKGMETGHFTGRKLRDYILATGDAHSFKEARRIINVQDKAELIAGYAEGFQATLALGVAK